MIQIMCWVFGIYLVICLIGVYRNWNNTCLDESFEESVKKKDTLQ